MLPICWKTRPTVYNRNVLQRESPSKFYFYLSKMLVNSETNFFPFKLPIKLTFIGRNLTWTPDVDREIQKNYIFIAIQFGGYCSHPMKD
jgi:hypothetical protein